MVKCESCGREVDEVCGDGFCRACHKSISWESCKNRTWIYEHPASAEKAYVYVVFESVYADRSIDAVFSNRGLADEYVTKEKKVYGIEEWEIDEKVKNNV